MRCGVQSCRAGLAALAIAVSAGVAAADPVKVGLVATLSGPSAVLGQHMRDGFLLAVKEMGGTLGGQPAEVVVVDDELKPDVAVQKVKGLIERDKVDFVAGVVFSNVMGAVVKPVTGAETFLISGNAGPSTIAGAGCSPFFFSASYQNDQNHEVLGQYAQAKGYKKVVLMAPNYQAGKDALAGFKRYYKGEVADEIYTQLGQLDFSAELAKVAAAKPDAFFTFMPGGMGVNLVKQYRQAGLAETVPFLSAFTVDETTLPATGEAALGFYSGAAWAPDLDVPANKAFVAAFEKEYGYIPALYAAQGYDAAKLIASAVKATGGKLTDKDAVRAALKKADFASVRGNFKFNTNQFPIQDFYLVKVGKRPDGKVETMIAEKVFAEDGDAYADKCPMK
ncbi:ABC transporter substrate-binding protein [Aquabacter spiritensis]|uniref:Amino acid/amide ABC transporter substrate-binding protein (HAAT family) n=1 Tax=Aquabacter spiritensis TaxID=933073 RepID=A0A4R3LYD2_9HYPH|nr:ABC transporter substrate-binding protein [Aquabacter spiritensis]TCT05216.1 amino acid/amide ABC transporter substrate-binding protein (HAAT family) [Aquabacter spiritensis]